jgi:hypothetical protein
MNFIDSITQLSESSFVEESSLNGLFITYPVYLPACLIKRRLNDPVMGLCPRCSAGLSSSLCFPCHGIQLLPVKQGQRARATNLLRHSILGLTLSPQLDNNTQAVQQSIGNQGNDHDLGSGRRDSCFIFRKASFPTIPRPCLSKSHRHI